MIGFFIIHPKEPFAPPVDKDFGLILQEWALLPNNPVPEHCSHGIQLAHSKWKSRPCVHTAHC